MQKNAPIKKKFAQGSLGGVHHGDDRGEGPSFQQRLSDPGQSLGPAEGVSTLHLAATTGSQSIHGVALAPVSVPPNLQSLIFFQFLGSVSRSDVMGRATGNGAASAQQLQIKAPPPVNNYSII